MYLLHHTYCNLYQTEGLNSGQIMVAGFKIQLSAIVNNMYTLTIMKYQENPDFPILSNQMKVA